MESTIKIDGKPVKVKATAQTPRLYLSIFKTDMLKDLMKLNSVSDEEGLTTEAVEIFERACFVMAKQAHDPTTEGVNYDEWVDRWSMLGLYQALPEIYHVWGISAQTTVQAKKKASKQHGK